MCESAEMRASSVKLLRRCARVDSSAAHRALIVFKIVPGRPAAQLMQVSPA